MGPDTRLVFRVADLLCILAALEANSRLMLPPGLAVFSDYTGASLFTLFIFLICFSMLDCYAVGREEFKDSAVRVLLAVIIGAIATGFMFYTFELWRFPRGTFVVQMLVTLGLALGWRGVYFLLSKRFAARIETVIFFGSAMAGRARSVLAEYASETWVLGYVGEQGASSDQAGPWLGKAEDIFSVIDRHAPGKIIVLDRTYLTPEMARRLFSLKLRGLNVHDIRGLYERLAFRVPVDLIEVDWLLLEDGFNLNVDNSMRRLKRFSDIIAALALLLAASPLLLIALLAVRLETPGPVIYRQNRVGFQGKEFTLYKIRSMRVDAECDGAVWAGEKDSRVTLIGGFLRKTRIDEFPQLANVIKGEMSIVGPRPERPEFVGDFSATIPFYDVRHTVKPGITGWAQVCCSYGASAEDARLKLEYDLFYIKHLSALLEGKILLKTIGVIIFPKGAR